MYKYTLDWKMEYTNNSPDTLLFCHLDIAGPTRKNDKTAFTDHWRTGALFYFSNNEEGIHEPAGFPGETERAVVTEDHSRHQDIVNSFSRSLCLRMPRRRSKHLSC